MGLEITETIPPCSLRPQPCGYRACTEIQFCSPAPCGDYFAPARFSQAISFSMMPVFFLHEPCLYPFLQFHCMKHQHGREQTDEQFID